MKKVGLLFYLSLCAVIMSACTKDNPSGDVDLEGNKWRLCKIKTFSGFSSTIPSIAWRWEPPAERFVLSFDKEKSIVRMFLVANWWEASYSIHGQDSISLLGHTTSMMGYEGNEMWVEDTLNAYGTTDYRYSFKKGALVLKSDSITLWFKLR